MAWPASQDYNEAIQDPASAFRDPELRDGRPAVNPLGLPMPRSGNFADVYEIRTPDRSWAVKCFTRQVHGLRERYQEISACLHRVHLPFMVGFHFLDEGIRVRGQWYPVLKMHWVEGLTLNEFVRLALDRAGSLDTLAQIWLRLAGKLHENRIAHADLQHGNILLVAGSKASSVAIKLIDYDGMLVPRLANKPSGEVGHPAYQHPERLRTGAYCPEVDRFSNLVIFCALRALLVGGRPLWERYDNGDNLLFRQKDFESPENSPLFDELLRLPDMQVRQLATYLRQAARLPLRQTPWLPDVLPRAAGGPVTATTGAAQGPAAWSMPERKSPEDVFAQAVAGQPRRRQAAQGSRLRWGVIAVCLILFTGIPMALWRGGLLPGSPWATVAKSEPNTTSPPVKTPSLTAKTAVKPGPTSSAPTTGSQGTRNSRPKKTDALSPPGAGQLVRAPSTTWPGAADPPRKTIVATPTLPVDPRLPLPSDQAAATLLHDLRERYHQRYGSPDPGQRDALAQEFLTQGEDDATEPLTRYGFLQEAGTLAAGAEDLATGLEAAEQLGQRYQTDTLTRKVAITEATAAALRRPSRAQAFVPRAATVADELTTANRYEEAGRVLETAGKAARLANLLAAMHELAARRDFVRQLATEWEQLRPFQAELRHPVNDPVASEAVGRFLCLAKGDWGAGLELLARGKGTDAPLKQAALQEQSRPDTGAARRQLAHTYRALSERTEGLARLQLARRAVRWYRAALGSDLSAADATTVSEEVRRLERLPGFRLPEIPRSIHRLANLPGDVTCLVVTRDGLTLAVEDLQGHLKLYDLDSGRRLRELEPLRGQSPSALVFSPTGRMVLGYNERGLLAVWDVRTGRRERAYRPTIGPLHFAAWTSAEAVIAAGASTWFQRIGPDQSREITRLPNGSGNVACLAGSADGKYIALGTNRGVTVVYTADRPTVVSALVHPRGAVETLAFAASGKRLVIAYADKSIVNWDMRRPPHAQLLARPSGPVQQLVVAPDGRRILWTTGDGTLHYADSRSRKTGVRLEGHRHPVKAIAFLPDGQHAVSADEDGVLLRWSLPGE